MTLLASSDAVSALPQLHLASRANQTSPAMLYVNPNIENTAQANGSDRAPFKTITQALKAALPNSVIMLAGGKYSAETGETFPLQLKSGVSIQGDPRTRGSNIIIQGGGVFLSPTFARQNVTILGANQATLTGVTITNDNPRGYGLWIESSSPTIVDNTFTGSTHDGISVTGSSTPLIRNNHFHQNGANGITIYGISRPEVRENIFEKTGFGINVSQKAAPLLVSNRITQNRSGVVIQAEAQPILRNNTIEGNIEDGVVAIAASQPDLGTAAQPGGNIFRHNGGYDINSKAARQTIPAFGNTLAANARTVGNLDLSGKVDLAATQTPPQPVQLNTTAKPTVAPVVTTTPTNSIAIPVPPANTNNRTNPLQLPPASGSDTAIAITVPPPTTSATILPPPANPNLGSINVPVLQSAQITEADLLPVPSGNIPIGNPRNLPKIALPRTAPTPGTPPLPPTRESALGLRYRVVVEAENKSQQDLVRSLVPGAFRTFANGKVFMQVGAFGDRANADEVLQLLNTRGLKGTVEQI
jgi:parallel beta-helix repeat protein